MSGPTPNVPLTQLFIAEPCNVKIHTFLDGRVTDTEMPVGTFLDDDYKLDGLQEGFR